MLNMVLLARGNSTTRDTKHDCDAIRLLVGLQHHGTNLRTSRMPSLLTSKRRRKKSWQDLNMLRCFLSKFPLSRNPGLFLDVGLAAAMRHTQRRNPPVVAVLWTWVQ